VRDQPPCVLLIGRLRLTLGNQPFGDCGSLTLLKPLKCSSTEVWDRVTRVPSGSNDPNLLRTFGHQDFDNLLLLFFRTMNQRSVDRTPRVLQSDGGDSLMHNTNYHSKHQIVEYKDHLTRVLLLGSTDKICFELRDFRRF
jgi:hypothetical protein